MKADVKGGVYNEGSRKRHTEFIKLYAKDAEPELQFEATKPNNKINRNPQLDLDSSKSSRFQTKIKNNKGKNTSNISNVNDVETHTDLLKTKFKSLTFTPNKAEHSDKSLKSMLKSKSNADTLHVSNSADSSKSKKRNKSVSFILADGEEVVVKKVKSNDSTSEQKKAVKERKKEKFSNKESLGKKKDQKSKENQNINDESIERVVEKVTTNTLKKETLKQPTLDEPESQEATAGVRKKVKKTKLKPLNVVDGEEQIAQNAADGQVSDNKTKKSKKKKRKAKCLQTANMDVEADGEPAVKTPKRETKPEAIAEGLENLNIGDNAHSLTNLLDEMTVVDKNKKKQEKRKKIRNKVMKNMLSEAKSDAALKETQVTGGKEKEKSKLHKRKWNKNNKVVTKLHLLSSVVVENLPLKIMCTYKTLLSKHFGKFGTIAGIGVAETYPSENPKPVFTTTIYFHDEEAATKALVEDNAVVEGSRVRVRRPLPAPLTTLVVHARAPLTDQALSSALGGAGRLRSIRHSVKGKKSISTSFVEFDGPEAVERALKMAEDTKIGGKKIHVAKFEIRNKSKNSENSSANDAISEDNSGTE